MKKILLFLSTAVCVFQCSFGLKPFLTAKLALEELNLNSRAVNYYEGECLPGVPVPMCHKNKCEGATCEEHPNAVCMVNICGQCNPIWFELETGTEVAACKRN